jgi:formylglycine-generating enzyme
VTVDVAATSGAPSSGLSGSSDASTSSSASSTGAGPCDPTAAPLPNEGLVEAPGDQGCLRGMVSLGSFCIDRFEASLVDEMGGSLSPYQNPGATLAFAVSIAGAIPQGYISGDQAADACAAAGKRLCTDDEWLAACRGPDEHVYPYGDALELGRCNDHRAVHPAVELFMTEDPSIYSMLDDACLNQLEDSLAPTGAFAGCVTDAGAFDLMGNLHEWMSDPAGTFRGGFYVDTMINGPGCLYVTTAHNTAHWDYSTGFRCCAELIP